MSRTNEILIFAHACPPSAGLVATSLRRKRSVRGTGVRDHRQSISSSLTTTFLKVLRLSLADSDCIVIVCASKAESAVSVVNVSDYKCLLQNLEKTSIITSLDLGTGRRCTPLQASEEKSVGVSGHLFHQ